MEIIYNTINIIKNDPIDTKINRYQLEKKIILLWQNITMDIEVFWQEFVLLKDLFSYKFNKRDFPLLKEEVLLQKPDNIVVDTEKEKPKKENKEKEKFFLKVKSKYGRKSTVLKMLNEDFTDESDDKVNYKILQNHKYYQHFSQQDLAFLLKLCNEKQLYNIILLIFLSLSISREYCHYIFQNNILDIVFNDSYYPYKGNPFKNEKYLKIIHHCLFYGFYILYLEECIIKGQAENNRHLLDFAAMGKIPNYTNELSQNPFIPLTLSNDYLYANHIHDSEYIVKPIMTNYDRGLYSVYSFWKRFDIFTDGMFRGLAVNKIYFGGSILMACGIRNPLEQLFNSDINKDDDLLYLNTVLPDEPQYESYQQKIHKLFNLWDSKQENLNAYFNEYYPSKTVLPLKEMQDYAINNTKFLEMEDNLADIDIKVDVLDDNEFDIITKNIYATVKNNLLKKYNITEITGNMLQLIKICSHKSYKYYISGTLLSRSIEIYRLYSIHPIGGVARFHFSCVRGVAIPTGSIDNQLLFGNVICHPSFYSFAFTGILIDYKWMAHGSSAIELVLKYYSRGCTVLLNAKEHKKINDYIVQNKEKWGVMLRARNSRYISINNPVFKPRQQKYGIYFNISRNIKNIIPYHDYLYIDEPEFYEKNTKSDFDINYNLRKPSGHINPIFTWQILPIISLSL